MRTMKWTADVAEGQNLTTDLYKEGRGLRDEFGRLKPVMDVHFTSDTSLIYQNLESTLEAVESGQSDGDLNASAISKGVREVIFRCVEPGEVASYVDDYNSYYDRIPAVFMGDTTQSSGASGAARSCPSDEKAESLVELWDWAMEARDTEGFSLSLATFVVGNKGVTGQDDGAAGCPGETRQALIREVDAMEASMDTSNELSTPTLKNVATTGNEWLESIGRTDLDFDQP